MAAGRYADAVSLYEQMVKALPEEPGARFNLALALDGAGRPAEALRNLELNQNKGIRQPQILVPARQRISKTKPASQSHRPTAKSNAIVPPRPRLPSGTRRCPPRCRRSATRRANRQPPSKKVSRLVRISRPCSSVLHSLYPPMPLRNDSASPTNQRETRSMRKARQIHWPSCFSKTISRPSSLKVLPPNLRKIFIGALAPAPAWPASRWPAWPRAPSSEAHELAGLAYRRAARWKIRSPNTGKPLPSLPPTPVCRPNSQRPSGWPGTLTKH